MPIGITNLDAASVYRSPHQNVIHILDVVGPADTFGNLLDRRLVRRALPEKSKNLAL